MAYNSKDIFINLQKRCGEFINSDFALLSFSMAHRFIQSIGLPRWCDTKAEMLWAAFAGESIPEKDVDNEKPDQSSANSLINLSNCAALRCVVCSSSADDGNPDNVVAVPERIIAINDA